MKSLSIGWRPEEAADLNARQLLPELLRRYFKAGRKLDRDTGAKAMHRFRLRTKQLRYTLEAFVPLYGRTLESKIDSLRPIQNALGDANDCEVLLNELGRRLPREVRAFLAKRADEKRREFLRYWREEFDAGNQETKWQRYLARRRQPQAKS